MTVTILQEDLDKANAARNTKPLRSNCLFALIMQRMGFPDGHVGASYLWPDYTGIGEVPIPDDVQRIIRSWERTGTAPVGASFELPLEVRE